jgi:hypothetical protein
VSHWTDAGYGTDPEGDAARRAALEPARYDQAALPNLADAIRRTAHLVPPSAAEVVEVLGAEVVDQLDPHRITRTDYGSSVAIVCACGRWECIVTGPSSAAWAGRDYRRHVADETRAPDA